MKNVKVKAQKGRVCPVPGRPGQTVTDSRSVELPRTADIVRLIRDGSLIEVDTAKDTGGKK